VTELPIIERTFDLIKWYIPILNRLPKNHKYILGDRIAVNLYDLLDGLILARYASNKSAILDGLNTKVDLLRYQLSRLNMYSHILHQYIKTSKSVDLRVPWIYS
jgi:hypothetical protein